MRTLIEWIAAIVLVLVGVALHCMIFALPVMVGIWLWKAIF